MAFSDTWLLVVVALPVVAWALGVFTPRTYQANEQNSQTIGAVGVARRLLRVYLLVVAPLLFLLMFDTGAELDCCSDAVFFSPHHRRSVYAVILLTWLAYAYSARKRLPAPPLLELLINVVLVGGFMLTLVVFIHAVSIGHPSALYQPGWLVATLGCVPILVLLWRHLKENAQRNVLAQRNAQTQLARDATGFGKIAWRIVQAPLNVQFPLLVFLLAPLLALLSAALLLFGQQPDSLVQAFRETHHHGLSALRQQCLEVQCRGHYLCTVAVLGHPNCVKPLGYGLRAGQPILCNRQLLVANAFEQLLEQAFPRFHAWVRRRYDRVGAFMQGHYRHFANPWLCDAVYWAMKPLEAIFVVVLYLYDREPERRIYQQYEFHPFATSARCK